MKKFYKNFLIAAMLAVPAFSWATLKGSGTEADPYQLASADDMLEMSSVLQSHKMTHFVMTADITFTVDQCKKWVPLNGADGVYDKWIGFDGKGHKIRSLIVRDDIAAYADAACKGKYYLSIFGVLGGYVRNTNFISCVTVDGKMGGGLLAGYLGHSNYTTDCGADAKTVIENCYFDCTVKENAATYVGAIGGNVATPTVVKNCYVATSVFGTYGSEKLLLGGIVGRCKSDLTVENVVLGYTKQLAAQNYAGHPDGKEATAQTPGKVGWIVGQHTAGTLSLKNVYVRYANTLGIITDFPIGDVNADLVQLNTDNDAYNIAVWASSKVNDVSYDVSDYKDLFKYVYPDAANSNVYSRFAATGEWTTSNALLNVCPMPLVNAGGMLFNGGTGTADDPYMIASAANMANSWQIGGANGKTIYYKLENDITFTDTENASYMPTGGYDNVSYSWNFSFDGNNHVVKGFNPKANYYYNQGGVQRPTYYRSLFGVMSGEVKNLGVEDINLDVTDGAGAFGAYAGHSTSTLGMNVENCYVTGNITTTAGYAGGFFGTNGNNLSVKNCWSSANVKSAGYVGGLVGRVNTGTVTVANSMSRATTIDGINAGGVVGYKGGTLTLTDVISWNGDINGTTAAGVLINGTPTTATNCAWANTSKVNGATVDGGVDAATLLAKGQSWEGWNKTQAQNGYPILAWQEGQSTGVAKVENKVVVATAGVGEIYVNDAATVYNVYGQVVYAGNDNVIAVPAGLYIVKVGAQTAKVLVK